MSRVTNIILTTACIDDEILPALNAAWNVGVPFRDIGEYAAGDKHTECNIYVGAFNHLVLEEFIKAIHAVPWQRPASVRLFVQEEEEEWFHQVAVWERGK